MAKIPIAGQRKYLKNMLTDNPYQLAYFLDIFSGQQ
jgi:hypothetical protein